jgi:hypothetical protein
MTAMAAIKDPRAEEAVRRWGELKQARAHHEQDWEELARLIRPQRGGFSAANPALKRDEKPLSSAPIIAQEYFSSGLYSVLTNPASRWMGIEVTDPDLALWQPVREWQDLVGGRILMSFAPGASTFYDSAIQVFADIATFGNAANYDEARPDEQKIMDVTLSLAEVVYEIDAFGRVVEVVRKFRLTGRAAAGMFGLDALPPRLRGLAENGSVDQADFYHHVHLNMDWKRGRLGPRGKRWLSTYCCEEGPSVVRESGYAEMPFYAPRWEVDTGQTYGRGPGMTALPDARVVNLMDAANLRAGQSAADPTLLAPDRDAMPLTGVVRPGEVVYGGVDMRGNPLVRPLDRSSQTGLTLEMAQAKIEAIQQAFHHSVLMLANRTGMTDIEVMAVEEREQRLMAPNMGRLQGEFLAPKIARRFFLLWRNGQLPPPPPEAAQEGVGLQVKYTSAAAMAQRSAEGAAIVRFLGDIAPLAEMKPRLLDRLSEDDLIERLHEARGAPARILRSREAADALSQARAEAEQAQMAMQAAQVGGGVAKDLASAQAMGAA